MGTAIVLAAVAAYFYGVGRLIRWASVRAGREVPDWWTVLGMLFWPRLMGRLFQWSIPDAWLWPEKWLAFGIQLLALLLILLLYFRLRMLDAFLILILMLGLMILMIIRVLPHITTTP